MSSVLIILSTLRYTKNTDVSDFYQGIVIESFNSVVKIAKKYKIDSRNLKRRIEAIHVKLINDINSENIKEKIQEIENIIK